MLFITGPLYSGKRTFAQKLGGTCCFEVQKHLLKYFLKNTILSPQRKSAAVLCPLMPQSAQTAKKPAAWHACSPRVQIVLCRCSAAFRPP